MNDTACFSIQQIGKHVKEKDKESQKIYRALTKRCNQYLSDINKIVDNKMDYYCDYCTEMDNICDSSYFNFRTSLKDTYKKAGIDDYEYMAQVETMRSMIELSVEAGKRVLEDINKYSINAKYLGNFLFLDILRVANNFSNWAYRKVSKDARVNLNEHSDVMKNFRELSACMIDYESFNTSYLKATQLDKERNIE